MFSKDWKLALIVSLSATLLTACGSDKKEEKNENPNAGAYVNETALGHFKKYSMEDKNDALFCKIVLSTKFRGVHGVDRSTNGWSSEVNAFTIDGAGNVRHFEYSENRGTKPEGAVSFTGDYVGNVSIASLVPVKSVMLLDPKSGVMTIKDKQTRKSISYIRADRAMVASYLIAADNCVFDKEGKGAYDYENNGRRYFLDEGDEVEITLPPIQGPGHGHHDEDLSGGKDGFISDADLEIED